MGTQPMAIAKGKGKDGGSGWSWVLSPAKMRCVQVGTTQSVGSKLWEAEEATAAHDQTLMKATEEINAILEEVAQKSPHRRWELSIIWFRSRYMLAWSERVEGLHHDSDPRAIAETLRLRRDDPFYPT